MTRDEIQPIAERLVEDFGACLFGACGTPKKQHHEAGEATPSCEARLGPLLSAAPDRAGETREARLQAGYVLRFCRGAADEGPPGGLDGDTLRHEVELDDCRQSAPCAAASPASAARSGGRLSTEPRAVDADIQAVATSGAGRHVAPDEALQFARAIRASFDIPDFEEVVVKETGKNVRYV